MTKFILLAGAMICSSAGWSHAHDIAGISTDQAQATAQDGQNAPAASAQSVPTTDRGPAAAQADATQIGQMVETEFPKYDADRDGEIDQAEFGNWMVALRRATDPATDPKSAEVQTWIGQAFASADADKSNKVSRAELTVFLAKGAS